MQQLLKKKDLEDPDFNISKIICKYITNIYWKQIFTCEIGCTENCGTGKVIASFTPITDEDVLLFNGGDIITDNQGYIELFGSIYTQTDQNSGYECCSGWSLMNVYIDEQECYKSNSIQGESIYGKIEKHTYELLYRQLIKSKNGIIEIYSNDDE